MAEQQYTVAQVIDAVKDSGGNMSIVAKRLGCDRSTVMRYANRYVTIREALQQADEAVTDLAESKAIKLINEEYWPAIMHRLNTKGKARNIRFKVFAQRGNTRQTWRSCLRRCTWGEVEALGKEPESGEDDRPFMDLLDKRGLGHLLTYDGRPMPNSQIVTPWREVRDKMAAQRGMAPVNYKSDA